MPCSNHRVAKPGPVDTVGNAAKHALDINNGVLLRHLPAPGTARNVAVDDGTEWKSRPLVEADISDLDHTDADAAHVAEANTFTEGQSIETDATAAVPVLTLEQGDVSEEFLRLIGTSAADATQSLVDAADLTTPGALKGWIKVYIQDDAVSGAITDGVYYVPFYAAPTA